jgi:hypothetical protein
VKHFLWKQGMDPEELCKFEKEAMTMTMAMMTDRSLP